MTVATWYFQPRFGLCTFLPKQTVTHFAKAPFFGFFSPRAAQFQHMVWHFQLLASNFQSQLSFLRLWNILCSVFEWQHFYITHFFRNLSKGQALDSGNNKGGRIFWRPFFNFFFSPHVKNHFLFIFPCSIAKILVVLQAFQSLEAPLWLHFSILAKHIFIPCF